MDTDDTDSASGEAAPPSPAPLPLPDQVFAAGSLVAPSAAPDAGSLSDVLQDLHQRAAGYATRARGPGTLRTYRSAWRAWEAWCASLVSGNATRWTAAMGRTGRS